MNMKSHFIKVFIIRSFDLQFKLINYAQLVLNIELNSTNLQSSSPTRIQAGLLPRTHC